jgi:MFS family permease
VSDPRPDSPQNIATAIAEISDRATLLVHEEIELAKAEVTEKLTTIARGAAVGVVAGVFFLMALILGIIGGAWLLYFYLPVGDFAYFWGFFAMAVILILLGAIAGLIASRVLKKSSPPVPTMAIEEAQLIRDTVTAPHVATTPPASPTPRQSAPTAHQSAPPTPAPAPAPQPPPASPAQGAAPASAAAPVPPAGGAALGADANFQRNQEGEDS